MNNEVNSRRLFGESDADEIWVQGESVFPDSKILLTLSNSHGDRTVLITPTEVVPRAGDDEDREKACQRHTTHFGHFVPRSIASATLSKMSMRTRTIAQSALQAQQASILP